MAGKCPNSRRVEVRRKNHRAFDDPGAFGSEPNDREHFEPIVIRPAEDLLA